MSTNKSLRNETRIDVRPSYDHHAAAACRGVVVGLCLLGVWPQALGIGEDDPPPWLINMQRYGPPLSYPHLRIPGLNAPIPAGARYGFGSSEWGKPPVDSKGNPLYGGEADLFSCRCLFLPVLFLRGWGALWP